MLPDVAGAYVVFGIGEALFGAPIDQVTEVLDLTQPMKYRFDENYIRNCLNQIYLTAILYQQFLYLEVLVFLQLHS
jgi:hypothetical protein